MYEIKNSSFESHCTIPDALTPEECTQIKNFESSFCNAGVGPANAVNRYLRRSNVKWIFSDTKDYQWLFEKISGIVNYVNTEVMNVDLRAMEDLQITEYGGEYEGHYGQHADSSYGNNVHKYRKLSITIQLSEDKDYEGGDLLLYPFNFTEPFKASRSIGAMTLFRSHVIHEVIPVTQGTRHSLVTWLQGPIYR